MTEDPDDSEEPDRRLTGLMHAVEAHLHLFLRESTTYVNKDALAREYARRIVAECERRPR